MDVTEVFPHPSEPLASVSYSSFVLESETDQMETGTFTLI